MYEIQGITPLLKRFEKVPDATKRRALKGALKKAAVPILSLARGLVPVRTGNLRDSLSLFFGKNREFASIHVGARKGKDKKNDGYYAHFVEDEHITRSGTFTKANPFMKKSAQLGEAEAVRIFKAEINNEIKKVLK